MNTRFERQQDLVPQDRLAALTATVIGVGAIGRASWPCSWPRLESAACNSSTSTGSRSTNVTSQGYWQADVGQLKVDATRAAVEAIDPTITVETLR